MAAVVKTQRGGGGGGGGGGCVSAAAGAVEVVRDRHVSCSSSECLRRAAGGGRPQTLNATFVKLMCSRHHPMNAHGNTDNSSGGRADGPAGRPAGRMGRQCWGSATFPQLIIGIAEPIDDRSHNRFMGRHFENFRTWIVGRGIDINHHSIRDIDQNLPNADVVLYCRHGDICASDFRSLNCFSLSNFCIFYIALTNNR